MDYLRFRNADEVLETLGLLGTTPRAQRARIEKLAGFDSMLDVYDRVVASDNEDQLKQSIAEHGAIVSLSKLREGSNEKAVSLKVHSPYAAIVNEKGDVEVENTRYNILTPEGRLALSSKLPNPFPEHTDPATGYKYVEAAAWWKAQCSHLPCGPYVWLPGYSTHYFEIKYDVGIGKTDIVIQLWKGYLPKAGPHPLFPGGTGLEIGVYYRNWPASKLPLIASSWWPYSEPLWLEGVSFAIDFELINPENGNLFFKGGPQSTWWNTRWMLNESYKQYEKSQSSVPSRTNEYWLKYKINGYVRLAKEWK
jgi:hypothetical protein